VDIAKREGMRIKYVFETHRNEDYVIGSSELASLTGAEIFHGPWPEFEYGKKLKDGQEFRVGKLKVTALHTPGHTPGCMSYAVTDLATGGYVVMVFTGNTNASASMPYFIQSMNLQTLISARNSDATALEADPVIVAMPPTLAA